MVIRFLVFCAAIKKNDGLVVFSNRFQVIFELNQKPSNLSQWEKIPQGPSLSIAYMVDKYKFMYEPIYVARCRFNLLNSFGGNLQINLKMVKHTSSIRQVLVFEAF
jgi:hypothetical protein